MSYARKLARTQLKKSSSIQNAITNIGQVATALVPISKDLNEARALLAQTLEDQGALAQRFDNFRQAVITYLQKLGMPDVSTTIVQLEQEIEKAHDNIAQTSIEK